MQPTGFQWKTPDGLAIQAFHWQVEKPRAAACIVHGLGEHSRRYDHVAEFFSKNSIASLAADHRGHGRSEGKRGHSPSLDAYLDEIATLIGFAEKKHPGAPVFLYGHSMGGNLALNFVLRRKHNLRGVVATGSWIRLPKPPSPLLVGFAKIMSRLAPTFDQPNGLDAKDLSRDPALVEAYLADPLRHERITAAAGLAMMEAATWLNSFSGKMPVPALLMHGGGDAITDPTGSRDFAERVSGDVTFRPWEGLLHEIHNEPEQALVLSAAVEWMLKHC